MQEKDDTKPSNAEDGSEDTDAKAKEEKEDSKKDKKKKAKKGKVKSESPEPMAIDDEFGDTQVRHAVHLYSTKVHKTGFCPDFCCGGLQGYWLRSSRCQGGQGEGGGCHTNTQVS